MNILRTIIARVSEMPAHSADAIGIKSSAATTYGASASSIVASVAGWNWTAIITGVVAIVGLAVNVYFQVRRDRRESRESEARIAALKERCDL
ncbi:holin [Castellaniella ginsengisoli]|uniref:Holin n=1 Tax=Castellaniella ginsengisoli TaxID=546114 RepID=A0AB39D311_9BURK